MSFLILCSVLYSVLLGDNINSRMQTKSNLGILRNGGREMRVEGSSQGRLQGGLSYMPRDKQSLSRRLANGWMFWAGDSMSSDSGENELEWTLGTRGSRHNDPHGLCWKVVRVQSGEVTQAS